MNEPSWQKKHFTLALLTFACALADAGVFRTLGGAVKWLAANTPPFIWAGLAGVTMVAVRVLFSVRQHRRRGGLPTRLTDLASF